MTSCFTGGVGELDRVGGEDFDSSLLRRGVEWVRKLTNNRRNLSS